MITEDPIVTFLLGFILCFLVLSLINYHYEGSLL